MVEKEFFPKWPSDLLQDAEDLGNLLFGPNFHPPLFMLCFAVGVKCGDQASGAFRKSSKGPRTGLSRSDLDLIFAMQLLAGERQETVNVEFAESRAHRGLEWLLEQSNNSDDRLSAVVEAIQGFLAAES